MSAVVSQQVSFWSVHQWAQRFIDAAPDHPMIGTPAWRALPNDHPAKWASVADAGQHHALRVETAQELRAEASRQIAAAADWVSAGNWMLRYRESLAFAKNLSITTGISGRHASGVEKDSQSSALTR